MNERDPIARQAAISILKRGMMTVPEIAIRAGVSRQLVRYWCKRAGVDFAKVRNAKINRIWSREVR